MILYYKLLTFNTIHRKSILFKVRISVMKIPNSLNINHFCAITFFKATSVNFLDCQTNFVNFFDN